MKFQLAALVSVVSAVAAQAAFAHPIDDATLACEESAMSTLEQVQCAANSQAQWDVELNKTYRVLRSSLSTSLQNGLRAAQLQWLAFRDADFAFSAKLHLEVLQGTMWRPIAVHYQAAAVRDRVVDLSSYDVEGEGSAVERREHEMNPIDRKLAECMEQNPFTAGMQLCLVEAGNAWDVALNNVYGELRQRLPGDAFASLQNAQRAWIGYRDAELRFSGEFFYSQEGTINRLYAAQRVVDVTKSRFHQLTGALSKISE